MNTPRVARKTQWFLLGLAGLLGSSLLAEAPEPVAYPSGYRHWVHIKTGLIGPENPAFQGYGGFHHIYANPKALEGYAAGKFADGSILVFDLLEANGTKGNTVEGARKKIEIMVKDSRRFSATGGWGFERFVGDTRDPVLTAAERSACFACHQSQNGNDFVFSRFANR